MDPLGDARLFLFRRFAYPVNSLHRCAPVLKEQLTKKHCNLADKISADAYARLVQEAFTRAGSTESDGRARYGTLFKEIDLMANSITDAAEGKRAWDPRIKNILIFHQVLSEA